MKKFVAILALCLTCVFCAIGFTACDTGKTADTRDTQIVSIYNTYVAYAEENGIAPLSYEEWLKSIKGEKGEDGKSAYEIWLANEHTGSETDFLNWLKNNQYEEKEYHTVTFDTNGGTAIAPIQVENCKKCPEPIVPIKQHYNFDGWYLNKEKWSFIGYVVTEDITLTAKWSIVESYLEIFDWEKTATGYKINGLKDETVTDIIIPDYVTEIADSAFSNTNIENVIMGNNIISIEEDAFYNCNDLINITIPNSITNIGYDAFYGCNNLQYNEYENGLYLGNPNNPYVLLVKAKSTNITFCTINEKTKWIYESAFYNCINLVNITISDNVINTCRDLFKGLKNLQYNEYENGYYLGNEKNPYLILITMKSDMITSCIINNQTKIIAGEAFNKFNDLKSIIIPDSVTNIGDRAFHQCERLEEINITNNIINIGKEAFSECRNLKQFIVDENNFNYKSINGNLYNKDGTIFIQYAIGNTLTTFTLPATIIKIESHAFSDCNFTSINYDGTKEEWNKINNISSFNWRDGSAIHQVICTDGTIEL